MTKSASEFLQIRDRFFNGAGFGGLWMAFIGWFLLGAVRSSYAQLKITETLRGIRVGDVMTQN